MTKLSDSEQMIVDDYFSYTILEMQEGMPKYILQEVLEHYEEMEDYLPCAGIKKALDWYDTNKYVKELYNIDEQRNKIE
jgi:predicted DNA-binding protein